MHALCPRLLLLLLLPFLPYCSYLPPFPYQIDIQQGNVVTEEMVARLKPGMARSQVRFTLGTPLIVDAFHGNRWDYVYRLAPSGDVTEERRLTVFFKDERLSHIEGDFPQPPAFSEPAPAFSVPENRYGAPMGIDDMEDEAPDKQEGIDFLKENQKNFYKDDQ
ncbi:outer membrane protein assembly factor BamE [Nitrosomonas sp. HPC101]|uniref:outer membrane protein assembly factor BamE n=1 Tax=Nitrosomonas sp. HPC101 TaxID=1658667 RepID=UPI00136C6DE2|nr:outer membrane protein assembly factor BamE [Nitrosomonas sp. HPC101]MXS85988.1 outer membrane protein assembly factor BamE [Nitrosomonas sp. HPC101]